MFRFFASVFLLLTGAIGAYAFAIPAIEAGGGGHGCTTTPRDGADEPVLIQANCFTPAILYVAPGSTVEWRSDDGGIAHNVTLFDGEVAGEEPTLMGGESVTRVFDAAGVYGYYCTVHPSMLGAVVVGDPGPEGFALQTSPEQRQAMARASTGYSPALATEDPAYTQPAKIGGAPSGGTALKSESAATTADADSGFSPAMAAGIALAVGIVSVGGGIALTRRR